MVKRLYNKGSHHDNYGTSPRFCATLCSPAAARWAMAWLKPEKATRGTSWFERSQTSSTRGRSWSSISTAPKQLKQSHGGQQTKATMWQTSTAGRQITVAKS
ncbi:hypothetical protein ACQXZ0_05560 [Corynebacterium diphtheriae]